MSALSAGVVRFSELLVRLPQWKRVVKWTNGALQPQYVAWSIVCIVGVSLATGIGAKLVCNVFGYGFPAYASVRLLRRVASADSEPIANERAQLEQWVSYWIIFASFVVIESVGSVVERLSPLYYPLKFCFLFYCHELSAEARGARVVRERVVAVLSIAGVSSSSEPAPRPPSSSGDAADGVAKLGKSE